MWKRFDLWMVAFGVIVFSGGCATSNEKCSCEKELEELRTKMAAECIESQAKNAETKPPEELKPDLGKDPEPTPPATVEQDPSFVVEAPIDEIKPLDDATTDTSASTSEEVATTDAALPDTPADANSGRTYRVKVPLLNVRSGPSTEFPVNGVLKQGEKVTEYSREGAWIRIGDNQYVSLAFLSDSE